MSFLIKGAEMPSNCWGCRVETLTGQCPCNIGAAEASDYRDRRHDDCPLVEVPTPHGRLVDADRLETKLDERQQNTFEKRLYYVYDCVMDAPTIIEAEE